MNIRDGNARTISRCVPREYQFALRGLLDPYTCVGLTKLISEAINHLDILPVEYNLCSSSDVCTSLEQNLHETGCSR